MVEVGVVDDDLDERAGVHLLLVQQLAGEKAVPVECFGVGFTAVRRGVALGSR